MAAQAQIQADYDTAYASRMAIAAAPTDGCGQVLPQYVEWQAKFVQFENAVTRAQNDNNWNRAQDAHQRMLQVGLTWVRPPQEEDPRVAAYRAVVAHCEQCFHHYVTNGGLNGYYHGSNKRGPIPNDYQRLGPDVVQSFVDDAPAQYWIENSHTTGRMALHRRHNDTTFIYHL